ncbi:MAG: CRTAC1 family protein, partial [Limisphaerales bacterium]
PASAPPWSDRFEVSPLGAVVERGLADHFYQNDGKGRFVHVPFTQGAFLDEDGLPLKEPPRDWGLSAQFRDLNGDGAPDLYVCNDFASSDRIWINDGSGRFRELPRDALQTICASSMGVDGADIDRDGDVDLFVVDMLSPDHVKRHVQLGQRASTTPRPPPGLAYDRLQVSRNTLLLNRGDTTFSEIAHFAGVEASDWAWQPVFLDVDLDGFEDILVGNGVLRDFQNADATDRMEAFRMGRTLSRQEIREWIGRFPALETPNIAYRNRRDRTFEESGAAWGWNTPGISHGIALADLDNDGDMDVVVNNFLAAPGLYRNDTTAPRVAVRLKGASPNTAGIGAVITLLGGPVVQSQEVVAGGRYLSGDQTQRSFSASPATGPLRIEVKWRTGRRSVIDAKPNHLYAIDEETAPKQAAPEVAGTPPPARPLFADFAGIPTVRHVEEPFDESVRQPLLSRHLDRLGPGIAWHDINRDGWDDLIVGNGRGGLPIVLTNLGGTAFARVTHAPLHRPLARDQTSVLGVRDSLIAGSSNVEDASHQGGLIRITDLGRRVAGDSLPGFPFACGPLALADIDGDGDLDLFVGGRAVPGRYPEPADSVLFRNDNGRFVPLQRWEKLGCVSGAVFSDLDSNGTPELVLAIDWSPIRVLEREGGRYHDRTEALGLAAATGWWNGVATGDFDGDGRLEIVASNWGLNGSARATSTHPRRLRHGDLDDNGTFDLIEARLDPILEKEVPDLTFNWARAALPFLHARIPDYATYGRSSVDEIYGAALASLPVLEVTTLASTLFRPRGRGYEAIPLPSEAQWAPAHGIAVGDLNGDGAEDLFLAQNFFAVGLGETRVDPSPGLYLEGDGAGGLEPRSPAQSGIRILGDQRGCALADFDRDGRVDLAVGVNSDAPRVLRNVRARPGLRIRLRGPDGNIDGFGAQLRLVSGNAKGPVREIQAGSGYWSQNSAIQVMNMPGPAAPDTLEILWPGGRRITARIPTGAREIEVGFEGTVHESR